MDGNRLKNMIIDCIAEENSIYVICKNIIDMLKKEQCNYEIIEYFFIEMNYHLNSKVNQMDDNDKEQLERQIKKYGNAWGEIIETLLNERLDKEEFYIRLWSSIVSTPLFETEEAKICALYLACMNNCIPYYKLQSEVQINEERYQEYVDELKENIIVRSLVFQPCQYYTDRSLALLEQIEQCGSKEKQAVLLSQIIKMFEWKGRFKLKSEDGIY